MKTCFLVGATVLLAIAGCQSNAPMERRAELERRYPNQEPFSKEQIETIQERAGAQSQSREGEENPFIEPKAGRTNKVIPQQPLPPQNP